MIHYRDSLVGAACPKCDNTMGVAAKNNSVSATIEHNIPLDDGGLNEMCNISIICGACQSANNGVKQYFKLQGELVPSEYWVLSLDFLTYEDIIKRLYTEYHNIFLKKRARFNMQNDSVA